MGKKYKKRILVSKLAGGRMVAFAWWAFMSIFFMVVIMIVVSELLKSCSWNYLISVCIVVPCFLYVLKVLFFYAFNVFVIDDNVIKYYRNSTPTRGADDILYKNTNKKLEVNETLYILKMFDVMLNPSYLLVSKKPVSCDDIAKCSDYIVILYSPNFLDALTSSYNCKVVNDSIKSDDAISKECIQLQIDEKKFKQTKRILQSYLFVVILPFIIIIFAAGIGMFFKTPQFFRPGAGIWVNLLTICSYVAFASIYILPLGWCCSYYRITLTGLCVVYPPFWVRKRVIFSETAEVGRKKLESSVESLLYFSKRELTPDERACIHTLSDSDIVKIIVYDPRLQDYLSKALGIKILNV